MTKEKSQMMFNHVDEVLRLADSIFGPDDDGPLPDLFWRHDPGTSSPVDYERDGGQVVECGRYSYLWPGSPPLEVGEEVVVPPTWINPSSILFVTKLGSTYQGELIKIIGRHPERLRSILMNESTTAMTWTTTQEGT